MKEKHGFLSQTNPIKQTKYDDIPFDKWTKREIAHEEACRDLDKEPDQLLVDIHDESLDRKRSDGETIARALARLASLELQLDEKAGKLNCIVLTLGIIGLVVAIVSTIFSGLSFYYMLHPLSP